MKDLNKLAVSLLFLPVSLCGAVSLQGRVLSIPDAGAFSTLVTGQARAALVAGEIKRIVKTGPGELVLDEALTSYRGDWALENGTMLVTLEGKALGYGAVTVAQPAQLKIAKGVRAELAGKLSVTGKSPTWKALYMDQGALALADRAEVTGSCNFHFQGGAARLVCNGGLVQQGGRITTTGANGVWTVKDKPAHLEGLTLTWLYLDIDAADCQVNRLELADGGKVRLRENLSVGKLSGGTGPSCSLAAQWPCELQLTSDGDVALHCPVTGPLKVYKTGQGTLTSDHKLPDLTRCGEFSLADGVLSVVVSPTDDLEQVRSRLRAYLSSGRLDKDKPVTVTLQPGIYSVEKDLVLGVEDSGTEKAPVIWRAAKRGTVRFFSGRAIPRTAFRSVSAEEATRLVPSARAQVRVADVAKYLVADPPTWPNCVTGVMPGPWLYHNGKSQTLARWPNVDAPDKGWAGFSNVLENCGYQADRKARAPAVFEFPGDRAARWNLDAGVWITGYLSVDWYCETARLGSYNPETRAMKLAGLTTYGVAKAGWPFYRRRFFVQNLLEELDQEGEWYLDRVARKLYWWPRAESGADEIVLAQALAPVIRMVKASHIRLENLSFEYSHGGSVVSIQGCRDCVVARCDFANHAGAAVVLDGGQRNRAEACDIRNIGGTAVVLTGGAIKDLLPANNLVTGCTIDNFAMYKRTHGVGISVAGCGNAVRDNIVTHAPDCALNYSGNEHLIANNEFGYVTQDSGDVGCIYSGHHANWLGTILFGNYIHDLACTPVESEARNGIYFDDCDWGDDVIGNTFLHAGRAIFFGGGKLHGAYNNLVKECGVGVHCDSRGNGWRARGNASFYWDKNGRAFCRYRHLEEGISYDEAPWCVVYPQLREAMDDRPEYPGMNTVTGNVFYACKRVYGYDAGAQRVMGKSSPGNLVITNAAAVPARAPQPIQLKDAVVNRLTSAEGGTQAEILLDESGHLAWTLVFGEKTILQRSPLGVTVEALDTGKKTVPGEAESLGTVSLTEWKKASQLVPIRGGIGFRSAVTNLPALAQVSARAWRIPLRSLITAEVVAFLEVRLWATGAAYRWEVPGAGRRRVVGENNAFLPGAGETAETLAPRLVEWERDSDFAAGYPEVFYYRRGDGWGICFPERAHGWRHIGSVVTPWRGVLR